MEIREDILDADTPDGPMAVLVKQPAAAGDWPVVGIFHDGPGVRRATHVFTAELAAEGFVVIVPDLYHRHGRLIGANPEDKIADPTIGAQMMTLLQSLTDDGIQRDMDAGLAVAGVATETPIAVIGFCLGAKAVHRRMAAEPVRVVAGAMWHPSFLADDTADSPHLTVDQLGDRSLYIGIGDADEIQSIAMHQRYFDAVAKMPNVEVVVFDGADHGYTWPDHPTHHQQAAQTSWDTTLAMFRAALPPPAKV